MAHDAKDFVVSNARAALAQPLRASSATGKTETIAKETRHSEFGAVPSYLKERQAVWAREADAKRKAEEEKDVPRGMRIMPEEERLETIAMLEASLKETREALSKFKFVVDVPSQVRRKAELEEKLTKLEEALRVFSKPRVLVKLDA
ncbi:MAG: hypothetical protein EOO65_03150 [Methanosarcinales archaeon]|nr:MAG: hypothetical protein EOO65_03150 [Methanosarcinales archaeon]